MQLMILEVVYEARRVLYFSAKNNNPESSEFIQYETQYEQTIRDISSAAERLASLFQVYAQTVEVRLAAVLESEND